MFRKARTMLQVTWTDVDDFIDKVTIHYATKNLTGVYGIPRGGLILAVMASHSLGIPLLQAPMKGCLVIDDISDTGITLKHYRDKGYQIATMFSTKNTQVKPDLTMFTKDDEWIVFPWERVEDEGL